MREFLKLNKTKVYFAFIFISVLSCVITVIVMFLAGLFKSNSLIENVFALIASAIFWPLCVLLLAYLSYISKKSRRNRIFNKVPFDKISSLGFQTYELHLDDFWQFTEHTPYVVWNGYNILLDLDTGFGTDKVKLLALVENNKMDQEHFNTLQSSFKSKKMAFDFGGIARLIDLKKKEVNSIEDLKVILDEFVNVLIAEHFEPASKRLM